MRYNPNYEKELNLRDLFFHILYRWRRVLLVALGMALLFGGIQYLNNRLSNDTTSKKATKAMDEYRIQKMILEQNMEKWAQGRDENKEYIDNSLYMKLDAMHVNYAVRHYLVQMAESTDGKKAVSADSVLQVYGYLMEQNMDKQELQDAFGASEMMYIREIASVGIDKELKQISIRVMGRTAEDAQKGCDYLSKKLEELEPQAQAVGAHTLTMISEGAYTNAEPGVLSNQQQHTTSYNEYNTNYEYTLKDYNALEMPSTGSGSIKSRVILGFLTGLAVMILGIAGFYLLGSKMHSGREISHQYSLPVFGEMKQSRAWRKGKGIDKLIEKWEFRIDRRTDDSVYQNIAALLREQKEVRAVTLASTLVEFEVKPVQENLQSRVEGMEISLASDFLSNRDAVSLVSNADAVLVVEKKHTTRNTEVSQMAGMLEVSGAKVRGAIIL